MFKIISTTLCLATSLVSLEAKNLQSDLEAGQFKQIIERHSQPKTNQDRFEKSLSQLALSLEKVQQGLYRHGFEISSTTAGIRSLAPLQHNPSPEMADYKSIRKLLEDFHLDLHKIETILASVGDDDFHLPLNLIKVRFDVNMDGEYSPNESSIAIVFNMENNGALNLSQLEELAETDATIGFDRSDLLWLKGYTQVLLGTTDLILAHDFQASFDAVSHHVFQKTNNQLVNAGATSKNYGDVADLLAAIHLTKMKVIEPERLKQARQHLLGMVSCSKQMWVSILAETDDRKEWLPSPKQNSVTGIKMTDSMVKEWHVFLAEYESILNGTKLVPHWRFEGKGINLKRVLEESKETDVILWITGHAAVPYLEEGALTEDDLWRQLDRTFNNNFLGMSFFIN